MCPRHRRGILARMSTPTRGRVAARLAALGCLGVLALALAYQDEILVQYHLFRLSDPAALLEVVGESARSPKGRAARRFLETRAGAEALISLLLYDFASHLGPYWNREHSSPVGKLERAIIGLERVGPDPHREDDPVSYHLRRLFWYNVLCPEGCTRGRRGSSTTGVTGSSTGQAATAGSGRAGPETTTAATEAASTQGASTATLAGAIPLEARDAVAAHSSCGCIYGAASSLRVFLKLIVGRVVELRGHGGLSAAVIPTEAAEIFFRRGLVDFVEWDGLPDAYAIALERSPAEALDRQIAAALNELEGSRDASLRAQAIEALGRMGPAGH